MIQEEALSAMQLRKMNEVFEVLRHDPYIIRPIERYGEREGVLISQKLWEILEGVMQGHTRLFYLPLDHAPVIDGQVPTKMVVVRPGVVPEEREVLVDWMLYTLRGEAPDYTQLLWRHHPDVARALMPTPTTTWP